MSETLMEKLVSLCKRRGFVFPSSEIYGGLANSWDFGPLGVELKQNLKKAWWDHFVHARTNIYGLDSSVILNTKVWEASGHVKNFQDPLVDCRKCKNRFRPDKLEDPKKCPNCGGELTETRMFHTMFQTHFGPIQEEASVVYLRPETAQGMFINYKNMVDTMRPRLPFGMAQIGKAFRNEITPGNFIFRTREFEQMEIEYYIDPTDWEKHFEAWKKEILSWLQSMGIKNLEAYEVPEKDRAHYSKRTIDFLYDFPFAQEELCGLAYRGDYDLKNHGFENPPHVIEPTFGVERLLLALLAESYHEEEVRGETRVVMRFPKHLAPFQIAILPLSKKDELTAKSKEILNMLHKSFVVCYDETQSIGKRYRRQDEVGTPYCVTVDFQTLSDQCVTVRDRDTMKQDRVKIQELSSYFSTCFTKAS